jgi:hypothetical protein
MGEFAEIDLGDPRRDARLHSLVAAAAARPAGSFPQIAGSDRALEAAYRFMNNPAVELEDLLAPHRALIAARAVSAKCVLVLHDTTAMQLGHADPAEVGYLQTGKPGFYAHISLAVSGDGQRCPLGATSVQTIFRDARSARGGRKKNRPGSVTTKQADRESLRWEAGVTQSEELLKSCESRVHVADREADSYGFLAHVVGHGAGFVVRVRHDRLARESDDSDQSSEPWSKLKEIIGSASSRLHREVPLSSRKCSGAPTQSRAHPARKARLAELHFATSTVELKRPRYFHDPMPASLTVGVVRVYEPRPPTDQPPVEWLLVTNESLRTQADVERVVDIYRTRWLIEEYFKALKSGCIYEQRQFESRHALLNALAIFLPIACHMLWLRWRAQAADASALDVLSRQQLQILRVIAQTPIPKNPTAREALLVIAAIGGHIKNNGEPGWASIRHGYERLLLAETLWNARSREM